MAPRWFLVGLVAGWVALGAAPASAQAAAALADAAESAYVDLKYEKCIASATSSIRKLGTTEERIRAYKYRGLCQAALSDVDAARDSFEKMLAVDINAKLPDGLSPRFTSSYFEAKGRWIGREAIALSIEEESEDESDEEIRSLNVTLKDEAELVRYVAWRDPAGEVFDKVKAAEKLLMEVPREEAVDIVALDRGGAPIRVTVIPQPAPPDEDIGAIGGGAATGTEGEADEAGVPLPLIIGGGAVGAVVVVVGAAAVGGALYYLSLQRVDAVPEVAFADDLIAEQRQ